MNWLELAYLIHQIVEQHQCLSQVCMATNVYEESDHVTNDDQIENAILDSYDQQGTSSQTASTTRQRGPCDSRASLSASEVPTLGKLPGATNPLSARGCNGHWFL